MSGDGIIKMHSLTPSNLIHYLLICTRSVYRLPNWMLLFWFEWVSTQWVVYRSCQYFNACFPYSWQSLYIHTIFEIAWCIWCVHQYIYSRNNKTGLVKLMHSFLQCDASWKATDTHCIGIGALFATMHVVKQWLSNACLRSFPVVYMFNETTWGRQEYSLK